MMRCCRIGIDRIRQDILRQCDSTASGKISCVKADLVNCTYNGLICELRRAACWRRNAAVSLSAAK